MQTYILGRFDSEVRAAQEYDHAVLTRAKDRPVNFVEGAALFDWPFGFQREFGALTLQALHSALAPD